MQTVKGVEYLTQAANSRKLCGDGPFTKKCNAWLERQMNTAKALLTTSCTHALEMSAMLAGIKPGDEVIMPSYTFVSTANAFVLRGAKIVFVDIRPDTMNIDEKLIEQAVTEKTKAIVPVHYAGVACEMDIICDIARRHNLFVIEDAAQAMMANYRGKPLGTIGDFGCYSYHETKNYSCGEGGALLIRDDEHIEQAEIIREKGTDRSKFYRGQVDKYSWRDFGSSYLPSELNAAYLFAQLEIADEINRKRLDCYEAYYQALLPLAQKGLIGLPHVPEGCEHNAHMFFIKTEGMSQRTELINHLKNNKIGAVFHYIPLHSSPAGMRFGRFCGEDKFTTAESERLLRLPMHYSLTPDEIYTVAGAIKSFFGAE